MGASRRHRKRIAAAQRLLIAPEITESMSIALRNALATRNAASVSGRCECGARARFADGTIVNYAKVMARGEFVDVYFDHERGCWAGDEQIAELLGGRSA